VVVKLIVSGAAKILAAGGSLLRGADESAEEPVVHRANCPRCDQKVRYGPARAGRDIVCPRCRRRWTLPGGSQPARTLELHGRGLVRRRSA
jgi:hypothetical protein